MTTIGVMESRPPFVTWEQRPVEDREASIKAGGLVMKDVDFAVIRAVGSVNSVEKEATAWLQYCKEQAAQERMNPEWVKAWLKMYEDFKSGRESVPLGLHVRQWPSISRAQAENLVAAGVLVVEDVAVINEMTMERIGMGARELKNKAVAYLESREQNKAAEQLTALRAELDDRDKRIERLEQAILELRGDRDADPAPAKPARQRTRAKEAA